MKISPLLSRAFFVVAAFALTPAHSQDVDWDRSVSPQTLKSDFEALYEGLQSAHANLYVHRPKAEYDALYKNMEAGFTAPMTLLETQIAFQKFTAFGDVAHARIDFPGEVYQAYRDNGGRTFPIYLRIADGRAYVGEDYSGVGDVSRGDEILKLNGAPIAEWLDRTAAHISADTPYIAHSLLEFSFPRYLWVELGEVEEFDLAIRSDAGIKTLTVPARTKPEQEAAALAQTPAFVLEGDTRVAKMLADDLAYLRPGPFYNIEDPTAFWDNTRFVAFIEGAFGEFMEAGAEKLIIDLRENPGGDSSFSDHMIAWIADKPFRFASAFLIKSSDEAAASNQARIDGSPGATEGVSGLFAKKYAEVPRGEIFDFEIPYAEPRDGERFDGDVYVLINRHTYSNAVNVASVFQDYEWCVIAGEKTSDMATTYGAMETFELPITGLQVGFPKAHIIRASGDKKSDGVTPDWVIATPIAATQNDDVLQALISRLED